MSESKRVMAEHLARVQRKIMGMSFESITLEDLLPIIFEECLKENMTFWFSFVEDTCVLNLRDIRYENYELNIRLYHETGVNPTEIKTELLINTFLITQKSHEIKNNEVSSAPKDDGVVISNDQPVPKPIREAIKKIEAKGIPVTPEAIQHHLPLGEMSNDSRMKCNKYLKSMEAAQ